MGKFWLENKIFFKLPEKIEILGNFASKSQIFLKLPEKSKFFVKFPDKNPMFSKICLEKSNFLPGSTTPRFQTRLTPLCNNLINRYQLRYVSAVSLIKRKFVRDDRAEDSVKIKSLCISGMLCQHYLLGLRLLCIVISVDWHAWLILTALGMGLCVAFIALVRLPSLKVSTLLLVGLLVYDVFWVRFSQQ